jgi:hypothetical protein
MQHSLETVWRLRDEVIFPERFGTLSRGVFTLDSKLFSNIFDVEEVDPRWLHYGVLEYAPTPTRPTWIYVTTGFSNPWSDDPSEYCEDNYSGFGTELVLETVSQSDWAIRVLRKILAYDILMAHGHYGEPDALGVGSRIPLGGSISGDDRSQVRFLIALSPEHYAAGFSLPSGKVDLLHLVGITESERDFARDTGTEELVEKLRVCGVSQATKPERESVV